MSDFTVLDGITVDDIPVKFRAENVLTDPESLFPVPVDEAVQDWLDEHPEATTTVQDGSLTKAKFSDALKLETIKDYVTPQMFGAKGDGVTDDTQAIQECIDDCYSRGIYRIFFPRGTYLVTSPIVIYFSYVNFWHGKGITLEGEHKGDTIIKKSGTATYKNIDTVIFCDTGNEGYNDGTGCIVKNFTLENESDAEYAYCINGLHYSRGQFKNLTVIGKYGIFCEGGYSNIFDDIIGSTTETFFRDGSTSTLVGKIGCFRANNPYILRSTYATYNVLFGDNCTGTFVDVSPYGNCHISTIGTESPNLDCVVQSGSSAQYAQSKAVTIDNIFCFNLVSENPKYLRIKDSRLRIEALTIEYQRTPVQATICYFDSTYGSCHIGEIGHFTNAASYDKSLVELTENHGSRNHFYVNNTEFTGYYTKGILSLGGDPSSSGIGESKYKHKIPSVVMGGYFRHSAQYGSYFRSDGTEMRYNVMPSKGSLILNDLTNENSNIGAAGFISLASSNAEQYGILIENKAPIPIMYCTTEANVPSVALKNGTLLFNTSTSKLEVYYNNAWVVIGS